MPERMEMLSIADVKVPLVIQDVANVVLTSAALTGSVVAALVRAMRESPLQNIQEIELKIERAGAQLEILSQHGKSILDLKRFESVVASYNAFSFHAALISEPCVDSPIGWQIENTLYQDMAAHDAYTAA